MKFITRVTAAALFAYVVVMLALAASASSHTCKDTFGFNENLKTNSSGDWGSIVGGFGDTQIQLTVEEGFEVTLCLKKGNGTQVTTAFGEGSYSLESATYFPDLGNDGFSHYDFSIKEIPPSTTTTIPATTTTIPETTTTNDETPPSDTPTDNQDSDAPVAQEDETVLPFTGTENTPTLLGLSIVLLALGGYLVRACRPK